MYFLEIIHVAYINLSNSGRPSWISNITKQNLTGTSTGSFFLNVEQ